MNFDNIKELTIPEGKVAQIMDASGRVLWSAGYKIMFDFGTITLTQGTSNYYYSETISTPEIDFSLCNTLLVNGVAYDVVYTYTESSTMNYHRFALINKDITDALSEENPYRCLVRCRKHGEQEEWEKIFHSYTGGTYEVSLGRL